MVHGRCGALSLCADRPLGVGPGGFLGDAGVLDFAGGTVVHINAGVAGLVGALVLGKRKGYGTEMFAPHNLVLSVIGASLLWVGWFGFNAGSATSAGGNAGWPCPANGAVIGEDEGGVDRFAEAIGADFKFLGCRARNVGVGDLSALRVEIGFRRKSKSL